MNRSVDASSCQGFQKAYEALGPITKRRSSSPNSAGFSFVPHSNRAAGNEGGIQSVLTSVSTAALLFYVCFKANQEANKRTQVEHPSTVATVVVVLVVIVVVIVVVVVVIVVLEASGRPAFTRILRRPVICTNHR